jgi:hypothetical protein
VKALERDPDIMGVARRWLQKDYVSPEQLRATARDIKKLIHENVDGLPEGQVLFLSHLAGAMNQDATVIENNRIRQKERLDE